MSASGNPFHLNLEPLGEMENAEQSVRAGGLRGALPSTCCVTWASANLSVHSVTLFHGVIVMIT